MSAMISLFASFFIGLFFGDYAFFAGSFASVIIYCILMKTVTLKKYNQNIGEEVLFDIEKD